MMHAPTEREVCNDRQAPPAVRSVQGVIRNCLQKLWIAPIAHWQTGSRLPPLSSLGVAWLFLLLHCPSQGRLSRSSFLRLDILMYNAGEAFTRESEVLKPPMHLKPPDLRHQGPVVITGTWVPFDVPHAPTRRSQSLSSLTS